jgi:uncharacterized membrane protein
MDSKSQTGIIAILGIAAAAWFLGKKGVPTGTDSLDVLVYDSVTFLGIEGASVMLGSATKTTDAQGHCIFNKIAEGTYNISISKTDYTTKEDSVNIVAGINTLNVSLQPIPPATGTLQGQIMDYNGVALSGVQITIGGASTYTNPAGQFTFTNITPGEYVVTVSKAGYITQTF